MSENMETNLKVQEVIDRILKDMCGGPKFEQTCDVITVGSPDNEVTGIDRKSVV